MKLNILFLPAKKNLKIIVLLFLILVIIVSNTAASANSLTVYVNFHEEEARRLLDLFSYQTNINYTFLKMSSQNTNKRIIAEKELPRADIILGGPADNHQLLAELGLLKAYISPEADQIPDQFKSNQGFWTGIYLGPISIAVNEGLWQQEFGESSFQKPQEFIDLLNPAFKGKIVMPNPVTSGTAFTFIASIIQLWGPEKAAQYFYQLNQNVALYTEDGFTPARKIALGEYLIAVNFLHDQKLMIRNGFNLSYQIPADTGWEIGCVSIVNNAPHPAAAQKFIDFILSREAAILHRELTERIPTRNDIKANENYQSIFKFTINKEYNIFTAAAHKQDYLNFWQQSIKVKN